MMKKYPLPRTLVGQGVRLGLFIASMLLVVVSIVQAIEIPPDGSAAFIQTSGPNAPINVGDYYTSFQGAEEAHFVRVNIPCRWPDDVPITFALFDPELQEPDPQLSEPPTADDEIRNAAGNITRNPPNENIASADTSTFTLFALNDQGEIDRTVVEPVTYTPSLTESTNGLWVEFVTFTLGMPNFGCGAYTLATQTSDNDDNAWKLSVSHDPDCTVSVSEAGTCSGIGSEQSALLSNGNEQDDADNIPGTGDELLISLDQITFQHESGRDQVTCQTLYHPVFNDDAPEVLFHNFDLDVDNDTGFNSTVIYISPSGRVIEGTPSGDESWNNAAAPPPYPPERGGDLVQIGPDDIGLWQSEICVRRSNQYIFEGQQDEVVFPEPPPAPVMVVTKDDGRVMVSPGEVLTYTIVFTNISDTNPRPLTPPGAAAQVALTDELPPNTTFVSCAVNAPFSGSCEQTSPGIASAAINEIVKAGERGTLDLVVQVDAGAPPGLLTDTVTLEYFGALLGIRYPPVSDNDIDEILPQVDTPTPTATSTPTSTSTPTPTSTMTPTSPAPAPSPSPSPTPRDNNGDDDDDGSSPPPENRAPPPAPPTAAPAPSPTPTMPILFLPETGLRAIQLGWLEIGGLLLLAAGLVTMAVWSARQK